MKCQLLWGYTYIQPPKIKLGVGVGVVDLFSLLFQEPEPKPWMGPRVTNREQEQFK